MFRGNLKEEKKIDKLAKIIWDYHHLHHKLIKADCILALGSRDTRTAEWAAKLYLGGYAPWVIFSGGYGRLTKSLFAKPEAEVFADIAIEKGVPKEKIIIENQSTNTGDNIKFTQQILVGRKLDFKSFILVQKPYMERRAYATLMKQWPDKKIIVTSPPLTYEDYPNKEISKDQLINAMVGDLERIKVYPDKGFSIEQKIPVKVWKAWERLVALGYNKRLIDPPPQQVDDN
ncbi:MAG: YdcF family protein [Patescibacteria group bacterium]